MLEEHARRAVQLGNDNAFGTVDNERTIGGHERNFAHVNFILAHFFYHRLGRLFVQDGQTDTGAQRSSIGNATQLTFLHVKRRLTKNVVSKIKAGIAIVAMDREDRLERGLQTSILALI